MFLITFNKNQLLLLPSLQRWASLLTFVSCQKSGFSFLWRVKRTKRTTVVFCSEIATWNDKLRKAWGAFDSVLDVNCQRNVIKVSTEDGGRSFCQSGLSANLGYSSSGGNVEIQPAPVIGWSEWSRLRLQSKNCAVRKSLARIELDNMYCEPYKEKGKVMLRAATSREHQIHMFDRV